jgi:hypothetical protein
MVDTYPITTIISLIQTRKAIFVKAFSPLAYDLAGRIQACTNPTVGQSLRGQQDNLGFFTPRYGDVYFLAAPPTLDAPRMTARSKTALSLGILHLNRKGG